VDIGAWLRGLGLEQYEQAFRQNDVDADLLPQLTADDLKEIGVTSVGHRRRLIDGIAALRASREYRPGGGAERRQITVMFVDLVDSTGLSRKLDPEELRAVMGSYQDLCAAAVRRFGGHVAKYLGDGVLVYFGWPHAHEDDADGAVAAALEIVGAVPRLKGPANQPLSARIGIATGLAVVGDLLGEGAAREEAVVGEVPNLAARLQQTSAPGTVVIAESTRRVLGAAFDLDDVGAMDLHGFPEPVRAWRVLGNCRVEARFAVRQAGGLAPLVGRRDELALLLRRWRRARDGHGQVVLLAGEPGVGKSRAVAALRERIRQELHVIVVYQCSPQHQGSPLHPIAAQLERSAGIRAEDDAGARLQKLKAVLAPNGETLTAAVPLLAALVGISAGEHHTLSDLTSQQRKEKTLDTILEYFTATAARQTTLLVLEDLHWIDPTSLELLELLVDRAQVLPMLVLLTARPEFMPPWGARAHATTVEVQPLSPPEAATLARHISGQALPAEILEQIVAKTDGVPLFIEELTRSVLEAGLPEETGEQHGARKPLPTLSVPSTLQGSLMARLDRLAEAKEVAQLAACLGREFTHEMLAALAVQPEPELSAALKRLADSDLIVRQEGSSTAAYAFRHALVQEAAYQSLLKSKRQELHARIARTLEDQFPSVAAVRPEGVAHHWAEAGMPAPAAAYWLVAARRAKDAHATREAVSHLHACLEMIKARQAKEGRLARDLEEHKLRASVLLGDLASLAGDLGEANRRYADALTLASDPATTRWIENKHHRPRTVTRDGARIAYYEHGGGRDTLVLVAPLAYGLATFQPVLEKLCQDFRIVTVDSRGSGASDPLVRPYLLADHVKDVCAVIEALGDGPVVGVGISRGGNLLIKLAHAKPGMFKKLVTIGMSPGSPGPPFFSDAYLTRHRELSEQGDVVGIIRLHTSSVLSEPATRELQELFVRNRLGLPRETLLSFFDPDPTVDVAPILGEIVLPVLVTHGGADQLISVEAAAFIAARLPNAMMHVFEGKGHMPLFTATDEFCKVVRNFVRRSTSSVNSAPVKS